MVERLQSTVAHLWLLGPQTPRYSMAKWWSDYVVRGLLTIMLMTVLVTRALIRLL